MSSSGEAELRRIIDTAEDVTHEAPLAGGVKFSRIPARAAGMKLNATDWQVLHAIGLHADRLGQAFPSLRRIALIAGIKRNHVSRSTKRLEEFGLLKASRVKRGSVWANTSYQLIFVDAKAKAEAHQTKTASPGIKTSDGSMVPEMEPQATRVAPEMVSGGTSVGCIGGTPDGALTDHKTDMTKEERIEHIKNRTAGGTLDGSTRSMLQRPRTQTTPLSLFPIGQDGTGDIPPFASMVVE